MLLKHNYPTIYVAYLESESKIEDLKTLYNRQITPQNMIWYIHRELLPKLTKMLRNGELHRNQTKMVRIEGRQFEYTGDVDQNGNATGWGVATTPDGRFGISYSGTFFNNRLEGIITKTTETSKWIGEMHAGDAHGRSTRYSANDTPQNEVSHCCRYCFLLTDLRKANRGYQNFH